MKKHSIFVNALSIVALLNSVCALQAGFGKGFAIGAVTGIGTSLFAQAVSRPRTVVVAAPVHLVPPAPAPIYNQYQEQQAQHPMVARRQEHEYELEKMRERTKELELRLRELEMQNLSGKQKSAN